MHPIRFPDHGCNNIHRLPSAISIPIACLLGKQSIIRLSIDFLFHFSSSHRHSFCRWRQSQMYSYTQFHWGLFMVILLSGRKHCPRFLNLMESTPLQILLLHPLQDGIFLNGLDSFIFLLTDKSSLIPAVIGLSAPRWRSGHSRTHQMRVLL